ncbi:MAG: magnesium chelatase subunit [Thermoproteota archaeon]|nr:magnesium chelatase subunit [Thermoproteota archaeon]
MIAENVGDEQRPIFPFTAIVGQDDLKIALVLNAIDPSIGGVLFTGPKGTGKSSLVRAAAEILPEVEVVEDCIFNCSPSDPTNMCESCRTLFLNGVVLPQTKKKMRVVSLPIGASEDRVIGSLDVEKAIREGVKALQPGLLVEANQNILYIDEVNLLPDHIVDMILDSSASGWNAIEREGISVSHPSRFILVGTMNPEEGELRPQILDRFGLHASAQTLVNLKERIEVIKRNDEFSNDPLPFRDKYEPEQEEIRKRIISARALLPKIKVSDLIVESVAKICSKLQVDGYRPDIVIVRGAKALAAFNGRDEVQVGEVIRAAELALGHRTRQEGQMIPPTSKEILNAIKTTPLGKEALRRKYRKPLSFKLPSLRIRRKYARITLILFFVMPVVWFFWFYFSFDLLSEFLNVQASNFDTPFRTFVALVLTLVLIGIIFILRRPRKVTVNGSIGLAKITVDQMLGQRMIAEERENSPHKIVADVKLKSEHQVSVEDGQRVFTESTKPSQEPEQSKRERWSHEERIRRGRNYLVGKRAKVVTSTSRGRYVWYEFPREKPWSIALEPTIRAAAPYQQARKSLDLSMVINPQDLRIKIREYRAPFSMILLIDMSMSMAMSLSNLARAIRTLHKYVYRRRDRIGIIVFKGADAYVLQEPTTNLELAIGKLWKVRASDLTPMAAGMYKAWRMLRLEKQRNKDSILMLVIVSDGITNIPLKQALSRHVNRMSLSDAQADSMDVAHLLARDDIRTVIINTSHTNINAPVKNEIQDFPWKIYTPTEFLMEISNITSGSYYGLALSKEDEMPLQTKKKRLDDWFYFEDKPKIG